MGSEINPDFVFKQIRKYNSTTRQVHQDRALLAVGIHAGLLAKKRALAPSLKPKERLIVLDFLRQFCEEQGVTLEFK